jgi:D-glycero-D-manno-heptose 1,7-bisphosphate phosphatase
LKKAVFLDRDGTLIVEENYLSDPARVSLLPGVVLALKKLSSAGYAIVLISNQSGIGRGYFTEDSLRMIHERMEMLLANEGVRLDGIYYCSHKPEDNCDCRKPAPGMIIKAAAELMIDISNSAMVGDKDSDVAAGLATNCKYNLRIRGKERSSLPEKEIFDSLLDAVNYILAKEQKNT